MEKKTRKAPEAKTEVLNIRVPEELILELDAMVERRVFKSRSEAIREFAREYVQEQSSQPSLHGVQEPHEKNAKVSERGGGR